MKQKNLYENLCEEERQLLDRLAKVRVLKNMYRPEKIVDVDFTDRQTALQLCKTNEDLVLYFIREEGKPVKLKTINQKFSEYRKIPYSNAASSVNRYLGQLVKQGLIERVGLGVYKVV